MLHRYRFGGCASLAFLMVSLSSTGWAASALPPPVLNDVRVNATSSYDSASHYYHYNYSVLNPAANTGKIVSIRVDISRPSASANYDPYELTIPRGNQTKSFQELLANRLNAVSMVPVGITVPTGWWGSIGAAGFAAFNGGMPLGGQPAAISPGEGLGGFSLTSRGVPTIREIVIVPDWIYVSTSVGGITEEESAESRQLQEAVRFRTSSIGPSAVPIGSHMHWDQLRDDLDRAGSLGWVPDSALYETLRSSLASARAALDADDGTLAKNRLQAIVNALSQSTSDQVRTEARDVVLLNTLALIQNTPDTPVSHNADDCAAGST